MIFYGIKRKPSGMREKGKNFREFFFFSAFRRHLMRIRDVVEGEKNVCVMQGRKRRCLSSIFLLAKQQRTKPKNEEKFFVFVYENFFTLHFSPSFPFPSSVSDDVSQCLLMLCINFSASFLLCKFSSRCRGGG